MDSTSSVSKGVFVFKNGFQFHVNKKSSRKKNIAAEENENIYASQLWYQSYKGLWNNLEKKIKKLNNKMFSSILGNLLEYVENCCNNPVTEIPGAIILMGINMPDHSAKFLTLSNEIKENISPHVAILHAEDSSSIKLLVEMMIHQFVNQVDDISDESDTENSGKILRKSLCTFSYLLSWYKNKYNCSPDKRYARNFVEKKLIVIIPEFESFNEKTLQDFILICSSYINVLPFVIIFGVATSLASVHRTLPYQVSSKLNIEVFSSQSSTDYLNSIINNILFDEACPFHLGGKTFNLLTDIFLFYDLSVKGFIQNLKFAMLEHFSYGNAMALCNKMRKVDAIVSCFKHDDFENVRRLMSFRSLVESQDYNTRIRLLEDDKYFGIILKKYVTELHDYLNCFHVLLKCLHVLVCDVPATPLGSQLRELYATAVAEQITETEEYKQCFQFLNMLSKEELIKKSGKISNILNESKESIIISAIINFHQTFSEIIPDADYLCDEPQTEVKVLTENMNRAKLKEELLKMSKEGNKPQNKYERLREKYLKLLTNIFEKNLAVPSTKPFYEIFFFNNATSVKSHVVGSHRAAIHTALNNPQCYLQCDCCKLTNDSTILSTLPDLSIVYKLHLECGKFINMYDWLQAFVITVDPSDKDEEDKNIDPKLQARFTRAVAELEFLGFIKSSRRKTDHVERLTWGGC